MIRDLLSAFTFLTILPLRLTPGEKPGRAFGYFPLVGLVIGAMLWAFSQIMFDSPLQALLLLFIWIVMTGGLHLDGFADSCDGLLATVNPERRLAIMKDPQVGTWGAVGLILLLLSKFVMLQDVQPLELIAVVVAARLAMVMAAVSFGYARTEGLGGYFRNGLGVGQLLTAVVISALIMAQLAYTHQSINLLLAFVPPIASTYIFGYWASRRLGGGLTGDVYGAICEITELLGLLMFVLV